MPLPSLSLAVVGVDFPNRRGPGRRFEIEMLRPGDPVQLVPEPKNPADPRAVAVVSERGIQIGYLTAERCGRISSLLEAGHQVRAVFQQKASYGAVIRAAFDGEEPVLPTPPAPESHQQDDAGFFPDFLPPDE